LGHKHRPRQEYATKNSCAQSGQRTRAKPWSANVSDLSQAHALLHGEEQRTHADAGYTGVEKRAEIVAQHPTVEWRVALRRSKVKALPEGWVQDLTKAYETLKARVRARVEHPFHIVKNLFHHRKVRYRGLAKNTAQLQVLFALANLVIVKRALLARGRA
ncbi:MAG: transposase, partial [Verrucomicrobia bacterium]|nr:transposase [Verrucomicrobiota bacterium]